MKCWFKPFTVLCTGSRQKDLYVARMSVSVAAAMPCCRLPLPASETGFTASQNLLHLMKYCTGNQSRSRNSLGRIFQTAASGRVTRQWMCGKVRAVHGAAELRPHALPGPGRLFHHWERRCQPWWKNSFKTSGWFQCPSPATYTILLLKCNEAVKSKVDMSKLNNVWRA